MHIAICDDNVADRKQTERLMGREADKWIAQGDTFYTDSFGNADALIKTPMSFDAFMIDVCHTEDLTALDVVNRLREKGVNVPMILVCSEVNYRKQAFPEGTMFLDKPLQPALIHEALVKVKELCDEKEPLIELRGDDTVYVKDSEIMYVTQNGYNCDVHLADGRVIINRTSVGNFFDEVYDEHHSFVMVSAKAVINIDFIKEMKFHKAVMTDGSKFPAKGDVLKYILHYKETH